MYITDMFVHPGLVNAALRFGLRVEISPVSIKDIARVMDSTDSITYCWFKPQLWRKEDVALEDTLWLAREKSLSMSEQLPKPDADGSITYYVLHLHTRHYSHPSDARWYRVTVRITDSIPTEKLEVDDVVFET